MLFSLLIGCCLLFAACISSNNVLGIVQNAPEVNLVGKTFGEVEEQFGPFSMAYIDQGKALYVFEKTPISFFFDGYDISGVLDNDTIDGRFSIPAAVVLRNISASEICSGVSGRVKDYGIIDLGLFTEAMTGNHTIADSKEYYDANLKADSFLIWYYCMKSIIICKNREQR